MDFFSYLQNSGSSKSNQNNKVHIKNEIENKNSKNINKFSNQTLKENDDDEKHIINCNFKKGEIVLIVKYNNSIFNTYKGYYAEIKEYKENSNVAHVILQALNYPTLIKMPIQHFKKLD